ncbi:glucose-1-phosphate cytidylyltransferase, partial [Nodularia spumigena]|uniref:glucose-1-phosphate cytidylyltransferase n=1 Tax=Nodularia spumigena TaxID=70799 RepID=UPI002B20D9D7
MKIYSAHGLNDFVICCGYKGHMIKEYFRDYALARSDVTFELAAHSMKEHRNGVEPWRVTLVDTGEGTMTGGRLKRVSDYLDGETFCLTYGDGVSDIDITRLIDFHRSSGVLATVSAVHQTGRFGALSLMPGDNRVNGFREKSNSDGHYINGGYFVLEPEVLDLIEGDDTTWEREPLEALTSRGQLQAYRHDGFWQNLDTLRDKHVLTDHWETGNPPWKVW